MLHHRRAILAGIPLLALGLPGPASAQSAPRIDVEAILNDPEAPVSGNPKGDVTIVAFLDYNCPFCKKSAPDLGASSRRTARSGWSTRTGRSSAKPRSMPRSSPSPRPIRAATSGRMTR